MKAWQPQSRGTQLGAALAVLSLLSGCMFLTLKEGIERSDAQVALEGQVGVRGAGGHPIAVVVYNVPGGRIADLFVTPRPGPFFFALPAGTYQVVAFEDRNRDLSYQPGEEPAALFGDPTNLILRPGERRSGLDLTIDEQGGARIPFALNTQAPEHQELHQFPAAQLGTIVSLDDPRFSDETAKIGLWDPMKFLFEIGAGVYFLEGYDPNKIPVLFVHGAMGHPGNWKYLAGTLDRSRFQPWFVYYPTAPHLDQIARGIVRTLSALRVKYGFSRLILVAHSMGGLVTRSAINFAVAAASSRRLVSVPAFVSISSPFGGQAAAAAGVKHAPVVAPSWEDMAPGSAFLTGLPETPLPAETEYTLLFSYHSTHALSEEANDGTVALSSELSMPIQRQAAHVLGFNESHMSILSSPEVAGQLNATLLRASTHTPQ